MSEYGHKVQVFSADWDAAHARIAALEARCRELEAALKLMAEDGCTAGSFACLAVARSALAISETGTDGT